MTSHLTREDAEQCAEMAREHGLHGAAIFIAELFSALEAERAEREVAQGQRDRARMRAEAAEAREASLKASIQETREAVAEAASLRHRLKVAEERTKEGGHA